jgi:vacuolar-type H+-ATPase subunit I/STV1
MPDDRTITPGETPPGDGTQPGETPTPEGQAPTGTKPPDQSKWTLEDWKRFALDRDGAAKTANADAIEKRKKLKALETEKEQTEAAKLKEAGEFKALYEQTEAKVKEFEPVVEENTFLRDYAMKQLEATIKDWPEEVKAFDPGKKAALQDRLDWLEKSKPLVAKLTSQQQQQRQAGVFRSPLPAGNQQGTNTRQELQGTGRYSKY